MIRDAHTPTNECSITFTYASPIEVSHVGIYTRRGNSRLVGATFEIDTIDIYGTFTRCATFANVGMSTVFTKACSSPSK